MEVKKNKIQIVRNKSSEEGTSFWESVDRCSERVERMANWEKSCPVVYTAKRVGAHSRNRD